MALCGKKWWTPDRNKGERKGKKEKDVRVSHSARKSIDEKEFV